MRSNFPLSWSAPKRNPTEAPKPSWMAPPIVPEPSLTSWAAPPPQRTLFASVAPRISVMPQAGNRLADDFERVPPPPSLPSVEGEDAPGGGSSLATYEELAMLEERLVELTQALDSARASVESARREALSTSEREIVKLALAIAERVVGKALHDEPSIVAAWAREGIEALSAEDSVRCIVAPRVAEALMATQPWAGPGDAPEVIVDTRLEGFSCEIRGRYGRFDAGVEARLDAVAAALGVERHKP